jgi:hypothetical protein
MVRDMTGSYKFMCEEGTNSGTTSCPEKEMVGHLLPWKEVPVASDRVEEFP